MPTSFEHQIDTILERFNFNFTKYQLNQVIQFPSRAKDDFKKAVLAAIENNVPLQDKIKELGLLGLQMDTRQVEIFNISDDITKARLNSFFGNVQLTTESVINSAFPFPIENKVQLNSLKTGTIYPVLSDTVIFGQSKCNRLITCTVVDKEIEEPVPSSHLSQSGVRLQKSDTVFTMKKKVRTQLFHTLYWCHDSSKLILSVDRNDLSTLACQDQLFIFRQFLMAKGIHHGQAINVFGAIEPLYNAVEGFVTKLGHVTTDGNPVRIPLKGRQECLKKDHYHQAGEGGGHVHAKFSVAKKWKFPLDTRIIEVEVALVGQPKMLDTAQPLTDFSVNKVRRLEDFSFAIDKVLSYIPTY